MLVSMLCWSPAIISYASPGQSEKPSTATSDSLSYVNPGPAKCTEIGNFYLKRKKYKAAVSRFEEAVNTDPNYAAAYLGLGKSYEKLRLNQKAIESYRKYLDTLPSDKDADDARDVHRALARLSGAGASSR
jgi:tetratricopeptide (TPR) repeat protein